MGKRIYIVKEGDSLSKIADAELNDIDLWKDLAYINSIKAPYIIQPGQQILIPDGEPLQITVTTGQAAPVREAKLVFNPATVGLIVAGAALIYFWDDL